jgi:replicative DNA helicase Mcm
MTLRLNEVGFSNVEERYQQWKQRQEVNIRAQRRREEEQTLIERFEEQLENLGIVEEQHQRILNGQEYFELDFLELSKVDYSLAEKLTNDTEEAFEAANLALETFSEQDFKVPIRLVNVPDTCHQRISELRSSDIGTLVRTDAIVNVTGKVEPELISAEFECPRCQTVQVIKQDGGKLKKPRKCGECGWKGDFNKVDESLRDRLEVKVKELFDEIDKPAETLLCEFRGGLANIDSLKQPGTRVRITGYIESELVRKNNAKTTQKRTYLVGLDVERLDENHTNITVDDDDQRRIQRIADDDPVEWLKDEAFGTIIGRNTIKEALLLQAVGGVDGRVDGSHLRGDIHVFMIGDPGTAKTQLAETALKMQTKAGQTSGTGASGAGLVGAAVKDEDLGKWNLEGGFLTTVNNGVGFIDEFDKMESGDREKMHEAMNKQRVHISKASINGFVQTKVSVLAAANPENSSFDYDRDVLSQIEFPSTILQRFDLIFTVRDEQDSETDRAIARSMFDNFTSQNSESDDERFEFLRKYINHASKKEPSLTSEAKETFTEYYDQFRKAFDGSKSIVGPRHNYILKRLSEASAKLHLRDKVESEDAERAWKLLVDSLDRINDANITSIADDVNASEEPIDDYDNVVSLEVGDEVHSDAYDYDFDDDPKGIKQEGCVSEIRPNVWKVLNSPRRVEEALR